MIKKYLKNKSGITLVLLAVTIIVLLILVGIGVFFVFSEDGVVQKALWAKFVTEYREVEEKMNLYAAEQEMDHATEITNYNIILPLSYKMTDEEKIEVKKNKDSLQIKIEQLSEKKIDEVNLYWIDLEKIQSSSKHRYLIDIDTLQLYDYVGHEIYGKIWHTLDDGILKGTKVEDLQQEELWDGWIRLTLYYPAASTERKWRLGEEGEIRYDENLMWKDYTGPIVVKVIDVDNVWIKYKIEGKEVVIAPKGRVAVDIQPNSYYPKLVDEVKVKIYYDEASEIKEYKIGNSGWKKYEGEFSITENTTIEARAKKTETISDSAGNIIAKQEIWGRDNVAIINIKGESTDIETSLPAPKLKRKTADNNIAGEVAKVEATYPEEAEKMIYKVDYGQEKEYDGDISITRYGTHIIAYYYDSSGKRSKSSQIEINDTTTGANEEVEKEYKKVSAGKLEELEEVSYKILEPNISVSPTTVTSSVEVEINPPSGYEAKSIYYKIGEQGNYKEYNGKFTLNYNTKIIAYYNTTKGERSNTAIKRINNIKKGNLPYVKLIADPDPDQVKYNAQKVSVSIVAQSADKVEYSFNDVVYSQYIEPLEITENCTIYAKATNSYGETKEFLNINNISMEAPKKTTLSVRIDVNPEPKLTNEIVDKTNVNIYYDERAKEKYYKIDDGELQLYTGSFEVTKNCTIFAYAISDFGKGQTSKSIDNLTSGISKPEIISTPTNAKQAYSTKVTINFDRTANITRYKINDGNYTDYTGPLEITENCTITAYNKNKLGYEAESYYKVSNIIQTTTVLIDKGKYFILKLNYPPNSTGQEYKWQEDGVWKEYKKDGILLVNAEYKDEIINAAGELKIKIEDDNGKLIDFKGDYYFITQPISELMENIYMRWDRITPKEPTIILSTEEPAREVQVGISYNESLIVKEYKIVNPDGTTKGWQEYTGMINITNKNTVVYARGQDDAEVWTKEAVKKITNIDEEPPIIKVTADLEKKLQKVGIKVEVTDDVKVETVMWAKGIKGETYFESNGQGIENNSVFYVNENGYYTIYAKDSVGNTSTYTLQVQNVDLIPPNIEITVNPEDKIVTQIKIDIEYYDSTNKQYKIGSNNNSWTNYTGQITLTSNTVLSKGWKNSDNTVTIYAKGIDSAGNETIESYKILNLDLDAPLKPVITSNYGYPVVTEYGVQFDGETTIKYDTRQDITNLYSVDNGTTWNEYKGTFNIVKAGTILAKSVKKSSGLEVQVSKTVKMPADAVPMEAYDGIETTYFSLDDIGIEEGFKYINVDSNMIGKQIRIHMAANSSYYNDRLYIQFINASGGITGEVSIVTSGYGEKTYNKKVTIPQGTTRIKYYNDDTIDKLYEIQIANEPTFKVNKIYPRVTQNGILKGYNDVTISYFPTSVQKLYKIGTGDWKIYNGETIRLEIGEKIYAKGIDKNSKESRVISSYTSVLPSDAVGNLAYDEKDATYYSLDDLEIDTGYINVDSNMIGKQIRVYMVADSSYYNDKLYIQFINASGGITGEVKIVTSGYGEKTYNKKVTIPQGTTRIKYYNDDTIDKLYEIQIANEPTFKVNKIYPRVTQNGILKGYNDVTISYFPTSVQKLYKIGTGDWKIYNGETIRLEIGEKIYAKGIDKNGKESRVISSYTSVLPSDAIPYVAYDGIETTYYSLDDLEIDTGYINVDSNMIGKQIRVYMVADSSYYNDKLYIQFINASGGTTGEVKIVTSGYGEKTYNKKVTIPQGTTRIKYYNDDTRDKLYEIQVVK